MRLRRLSYVYSNSPIFFITACTQDRQWILDNDEVHTAFQTFGRKAEERGVFVGRYVLMPDHAHFFASFSPDAPSLSAWMKSLKNGLSKTLRGREIPSPHWQKGFFDHVIRSSESYNLKWEYVRENPVRAGLAAKPSDWPYQGEIAILRL